MEHALIDWDEASDPDGNTAHIADNGLTRDEVESVLRVRRVGVGISDSSGRPIVFGTTHTGRFIIVIYEMLHPADPLIVRPVTAYEVPEPA